jgi:hypothetical protein
MLGIDTDATKFLLSSSIPGNPSVKKAAARMADKVAAQFTLYLDKLISDSVKGEVTTEDVIKVLTDNGMEDFVSAFKKGLKSDDDLEEEQKKGKATKRKK